MENRYFKRDISWLSFNYRVLLEAEDDTLPLYERINFISIYSSNLEEFYKIRVADHKAIATGASQSDEETVQSAAELDKALGFLKSVEAKLGNEGFVAKAPAAVIEQQRAKQKELTETVARLEKLLATFGAAG